MNKPITLFLLFIGNLLFSQNQVINPSFEDFDKCPWRLGMFNNNVFHWSCPNHGSTDFFRACGTNPITKENYNGEQAPFSGDAYVGMYLYAIDDYREYVQGALQSQLVSGETYTISFYISLAEKSSLAIQNIEMLFTEERVGVAAQGVSVFNSPKGSYKKFNNLTEKYINPSELQTQNNVIHNIETTTFYDDTLAWTKVSFTYKAEGFEKYFTIGNFNANQETKTKQVRKDFEHPFAYYYLDEVSVAPNNKVYKTDVVYVFKNVLFEFDKAILIKESTEELDKLYAYLLENDDVSVEIYGHTDAIGSKMHNEVLSKSRAKAVSDYLINKGVKASRTSWYGYGSSRPKTTNKTDAGRAINRRVEFKLIKA